MKTPVSGCKETILKQALLVFEKLFQRELRGGHKVKGDRIGSGGQAGHGQGAAAAAACQSGRRCPIDPTGLVGQQWLLATRSPLGFVLGVGVGSPGAVADTAASGRNTSWTQATWVDGVPGVEPAGTLGLADPT